MRKKVYQRAAAFFMAAAMVIGTAGCGGGNNANKGTEAGQSSGNTEAGTKAGTKTGDHDKTKLVVGSAEEPSCFYPTHSSLSPNMKDVPILANVYETLVKLMPDGSREPLLAESWEVSEDGKDYTMHLRKNVTFHNGNEFNAEDVKYTLDTEAPLSGGQSMLVNYESTEIIDDHTVVIHLSDPYGAFLNGLASRWALIVDKETAEEIGEEAYNESPIGTGPYKLVNRVAGDHMELEAYDGYWGGVPSITSVTYKILSDPNSQILALENGEIDALLDASLSPLLKLSPDSGITYKTTNAANIQALSLDCSNGPAKDLNFRKALQCGINKDDIVQAIYSGQASTADSYVAPEFSGHPDEGTYPNVTYDPEKAKKYLEESNYNGEEFKLLTVAGTKNEVAAQVVQGQLTELGINCSLNAVDSPTYFNVYMEGDGSGFDGALRAGAVSSLDADCLYRMFSTEVAASAGRYNAGISSPELDELLLAGRTEPDETKRKEIYGKILTVISDNALQVPLYYDLSIVAYNSDLNGVVPRPLTGLYFYNEWSWN